MEFIEPAFVLAARAHGETGAIVDLLTEGQGRIVGHVAGGASRRLRPTLQPGMPVVADYRARTSEALGSLRLEPMGPGPSALFDDALSLAGLAAAAAVCQGALPERERHPGTYLGFEALMQVLDTPDIWPAVFVRFEAGLLEDLGFGLDLSRCAVTGEVDELVWVSPRTGRAVSRAAGQPYADRLLRLPPFLLGAQQGIGEGDIASGLALTAHFLQAFVFDVLNKPLPAARQRLVDRLDDAGRL